MTYPTRSPWLLCLCCAATAACGDSTNQASDYSAQATLEVQNYVKGQLSKLSQAAEALQKAAPAPDADGWNAEQDSAAVAKMRAAWADARNSYERVEGSIATVFHELDVSTDERYDGFIEEAPDDDLFDDEGVIGVHAIERILWSDSQPARVVKFESTLDGYLPAAYPSTREDADKFKNKLCARLVADTHQMYDEFSRGVALDSTSAFWGMIGSMQEQSEKTTKAASGEDESRYAQHTLQDMRTNLEGARAVFKAFRPWLDSAAGKKDASTAIEAGFAKVAAAYAAIDGPALPEVPETFNPDKPSAADLQTPYGKLWTLLNEQTDATNDESLVSKMSAAADTMGIAGIEEE
jgi:iron uptake system component EfeO